jgi:hypothetical protein
VTSSSIHTRDTGAVWTPVFHDPAQRVHGPAKSAGHRLAAHRPQVGAGFVREELRQRFRPYAVDSAVDVIQERNGHPADRDAVGPIGGTGAAAQTSHSMLST